MRTILAVLAFVFLSAIADTKPVTKPKEQPKKAERPQLPMLPINTNWGKLTQSGREFRLTGHPIWEGVGRIREDGRVFILWTLLSTGDPCPGVYDWQEGELRGYWGFSGDVQINARGEIEGAVVRDVTHAVDPPKGEGESGL